jgi:prepilin-type N-terminal cleavage/methylation domain-containing protein
MKRNMRFCRGFSLLELLAVVAILGVIAVVVIPRISSSTQRAKEEVNRQNIAEINGAVERWYMEKGAWPAADLADIGTDPNYFPEGVPVNPVSGSAYQLDATTFRVIRN